MRAKFDFVTNSSSTSYILALIEEDLTLLESLIDRLEEENPESNEGIGSDDEIRTIEELQEYVNDGPFDWVSQCRGLQYEMMDEIDYLKCKQSIVDGCVISRVYVDHGMTEDFENEVTEFASIISSDG